MDERTKSQKIFSRFVREIGKFIYDEENYELKDILDNGEQMTTKILCQHLANIDTNIKGTIEYKRAISGEIDPPLQMISEERIASWGDEFDGESSSIRLSFMPTVAIGIPDIFRMEIIEEAKNKRKFDHGIIDFCSNGNAVYREFNTISKEYIKDENDKYGIARDPKGEIIYEIKNSVCDRSCLSILPTKVAKLENYMMELFEGMKRY